MDDPFDLARFIDAQASTYRDALPELKAGRKRSHWMWFIFPQMRGLGHSETATFYGIGSFAEAVAYLEHAELGHRLRECTEVVLQSNVVSLKGLLGTPDDMKFRSCMTLFAVASLRPDSLFHQALARWSDGPDGKTLDLLRSSQ